MKIEDLEHPVQPIGFDDSGVVRFKENAIVRFLLDEGPFNLNRIAIDMYTEGRFTEEDYTQLMQLIGYSVSGYGDLTSSPESIVEAADSAANLLMLREAAKPAEAELEEQVGREVDKPLLLTQEQYNALLAYQSAAAGHPVPTNGPVVVFWHGHVVQVRWKP